MIQILCRGRSQLMGVMTCKFWRDLMVIGGRYSFNLVTELKNALRMTTKSLKGQMTNW